MQLPIHLKHSAFLRKIYFDRSESDRLLGMSCFFSCSLLAFRIAYTGEWMFAFLLWNLFLAALPYIISSGLQRKVQWIESNSKFLTALCCWILLLPNAFYILTDLFHLHSGREMPLWFDLAMIFSFAWNGLLLGTLSIRHMERLVALMYGIKQEWMFIPIVMLLNAFGIYIGRYLRYNSWDVITNPFGLFQQIVYLLVHPFRNRFDWSMILCFTLLLTLFYNTLKSLGKQLSK